MAAYLSMGQGYSKKRQFNEAILCGKKCLEIAEEIGGDKELEADAYLFIVDVYHKTNKCDDAILIETKAIDAKKEINKVTPREDQSFGFSYSMSPNGIHMLHSFLHEGCKNEINECIEKSIGIEGGLLRMFNRIDAFLCNLYDEIEIGRKEEMELKLGCGLLPYISAIGASKELTSLLSKPSHDGNVQAEQSLLECLKDITLSSSTRKTMIILFILHGYHEAQNQPMQVIECLQKVLKLKLGSLQPLINAHCYQEIIESYKGFDVPEKSQKVTELYYHGLTYAKQCHNRLYELSFSAVLGNIHAIQGNLDLAKNHLRDAVSCSELRFDMLRKNTEKFAIQVFDRDVPASYKQLAEVLILSSETQEALLVLDQCRARELQESMLSKYGLSGKDPDKGKIRQYSDLESLLSRNEYAIMFYSVQRNIINESLYIFVAQNQKKMQFSTRHFNIFLRFFMTTIQRHFDEMLSQEGADRENRSVDKVKVHNKEHCGDEDGIGEEKELDDDSASWYDLGQQNDTECSGVNNERSVLQIARGNITRGQPTANSNENGKTSYFQGFCKKLQREKKGDNGEDGSIFDLTREKPNHLYFSEASMIGRILMMLYHKLFDNLSIEQDEIVIIPEGPLFSVPYSALRDPQTGKYLVETKRIRIAPSIETLNVFNQCPMQHQYEKRALIIGDPEVVGEVMYLGERKEFPALPFAAGEARVIASILGVKPMIGRQATKSAVIEALKHETAIVHIAAHGSLENATIVLSPSPETTADKTIPDEEDYLLTMADVQNTNLHSQLVVLSCCHSGRGEINTEGVVGMCRAFLASGARAVLGSLWAISDDASLDFMSQFYFHLKRGKSASTSLQETIKDTLESREYSHPMYWAPYFLFGDDVTINI